ncbi:MAG: M6 family metalloprotease domain-containing protein [Phycisphaerae bacterium]|nr:M6 family metalloprotease domain-containing protein [Phycisphaerae bacterium]
MKTYRKVFSNLPLTIIIVTLSSFAAFGANYNGQEMELTQPDGTIIIVRGYGDEFYGRFESLDGYTLVRDHYTGQMVYAELSDDNSDFVPTDVVYDHRKPTDPNHPSFVARMRATERFESKTNGKRKGNGPALSKHLDINKQAIRQKQKQRRQELGMDIEPQPAPGDGQVTFDTSDAIEAAPGADQIVGLTILVDFSDDPGVTFTRSQIDDFCNLVGYSTNGNNGSVRDYFYDVSGGNLEYTNIVTAYVRVPNTKAYYREGGNGDCSDGYGYTRDLVKDAIRGAIDLGYDFSGLTRESTNNRVKCLNIFYAGGTDGCGWANGLWPHRSSISNWTAPDGTIFHDYQMTNIGTSLTISTFCHENGHMMCDWADYYDYGNDGISAKSLGSYCIMSGGNSKNPPPPNPYLRISSGWLEPTVINDMSWGTELTAQEDPFDLSVTPTCYKYAKPGSTKEYFLIENCQKHGRRVNIPDSGLMIWHVDTSSGTSSEYQDMTPEKHYRVSLEQADGQFHLETPGSTGSGANDLFHAGNNVTFGDDTLPESNWWNGSSSDFYISHISGNSLNMTFIVGDMSMPGDINMNGKVDLADFSHLAAEWMSTNCQTPAWCQGTDLDESGQVGPTDLIVMADHWLDNMFTNPRVINLTTSDITTYAATLNGQVTYNGTDDPTVAIYWGAGDGGTSTTPGAWDHQINMGRQGVGTFHTDISGLDPDTTYYFRCRASNSFGVDWANTTTKFTTESFPPIPLIDTESTDWHYRKGTSEPPSNWREISFTEDGTWLIGQTSIGFGDGDDNTVLGDMQNNYTSVYLRHAFEINSADGIPDTLNLRVFVDDGCIVSINGHEVYRLRVSAGNKSYTDTGDWIGDAVWSEYVITNASEFLTAGTNILAIHVLNTSKSSSDVSIDAELSRPSLVN